MIITVENDGQPFLDSGSMKQAYIPQPEQTCELLLNLSIVTPLFSTRLISIQLLQIFRVRTSHSGQISRPVSRAARMLIAIGRCILQWILIRRLRTTYGAVCSSHRSV
jgi:hypothetical protein